jgi:hypothetical protein
MKKRSKKEEEINDGHYLELMDRLYVQMCVIQEHLSYHPVTKRIKKVKKLINKAGMSLAEAYQIVGHKSYLNEEKKNGISKVILGRRKDSSD